MESEHGGIQKVVAMQRRLARSGMGEQKGEIEKGRRLGTVEAARGRAIR